MAKLKAPLMSLGASGALGKAVVYFPWKGIDAVREYVIPANPKSPDQVTQRGYVTSAVTAIHAAMADATKPITPTDKSAYSLWAAALAIVMTWFNTAVRNYVDQKVAGKSPAIYRGGATTEASGQLAVEVYSDDIDTDKITAGNFKYGTSKTSLISTQAATIDPLTHEASATITDLTNGTKYYWQFQPTTAAAYLGANSGIYYGKPHA